MRVQLGARPRLVVAPSPTAQLARHRKLRLGLVELSFAWYVLARAMTAVLSKSSLDCACRSEAFGRK